MGWEERAGEYRMGKGGKGGIRDDKEQERKESVSLQTTGSGLWKRNKG